MPFTISHAVLAPPLAKLFGDRLPIAALAIGMMTPDLYRMFTTDEHLSFHQWSGVLYPNLPLGLAFCLLWYVLYRNLVLQYMGLNKPISFKSIFDFFRFFAMLIIAVILGVSTHLIWDGLTHVDFRTFAFHDFLGQNVNLFGHTYPMHRVLQIGSSIVALPILLWMAKHYIARYKHSEAVPQSTKNYMYLTLLIAFFVGCFRYIHFAEPLGPKPWQPDLYWFIGKSINHFAQGFILVFTLSCVIFQFKQYLAKP